jgi:hypothetical protein
MIKMLLPIVLIFSLISCNSEHAKQTHKSTSYNAINDSKARGFDLSKVDFTENLNTILTSQALKLSDGKSAEQTIMGFSTYTSTSDRLLKFEGVSLAGHAEANKNQVVLHYKDSDQTIGMFELKIYTEKTCNELLAALNKFSGKPVYEKSSNANAIELDENGDEIKPSEWSNKTYRVWENRKTGVSYFWIETLTGNDLSLEVAALNRKDKAAKDWIALRAFDWYKI